MKKYTIGIDFGTLSGRAVLVDVNTGEEAAASAFNYPHGVMEKSLPCGQPLGTDWALQHPKDYLDVLSATVPAVLKQADISQGQVIGLGIDFTSCTMLPVTEDGTPLCFLEKFKNKPNAYVKLWKHHAAQSYADKLNEIAKSRREPWLWRYGGKVSSEWLIPKIWQVLDEDEDIYNEASHFIEASDWLIWQLTGKLSRGACAAGYKAFWHKQEGYPAADFFAALDIRLETLVADKLNGPVIPVGTKAGEITAFGRKLTGLNMGTPVAAALVDAHSAVPAVKITGSGKMLAIMGTSACHMLVTAEEKEIPGICGVVYEGILPGLYGYEAGQCSMGDIFDWFVKNFSKGLTHQEMSEKAGKLKAGESGLLALDWWNGNRSVLVDSDLSGIILGMSLATKPEEIYRALVEATAFGTRTIIRAYENEGFAVDEFYATGSISLNPFIMQIYANVIKKPVKIAGDGHTSALGAAIFGAVAAGYYDIKKAAEIMGKPSGRAFMPNEKESAVYDMLYDEYSKLHDYFGQGGNNVLKKLKKIRKF